MPKKPRGHDWKKLGGSREVGYVDFSKYNGRFLYYAELTNDFGDGSKWRAAINVIRLSDLNEKSKTPYIIQLKRLGMEGFEYSAIVNTYSQALKYVRTF